MALRSISDGIQDARNITDVNAALLKLFNGLCNGTVETKRAVEINNTAGKIIGIAKVQLANFALRGEVPNIPFLTDGVEVQKTQKALSA